MNSEKHSLALLLEPQLWPLDPVDDSERKDIEIRAEEFKKKGNDAFKEERLDDAVEHYNKALDLIDSTYGNLAAILFSNRSAVYHKKCDYDGALLDANESIFFNPKYIKGYIRRFKALEGLEKWHEAHEDLKKIIEMDPSLEPTYRTTLIKVKKEADTKFEAEKEEMMGKLKSGANWLLGKVGLSTDNFKLEQDPSTGSYNVKFEPGENSNPNFQFNFGGDKKGDQ